jgi:hypothetical protein
VLTSFIEAGKYDWISSDITEAHFPMYANFFLGTESKLYHFNHEISSENAIKEAKKDGYRPATIWDLLDHGAKNPNLQRRFRIVALGSVAEVVGYRRVACLGRDDHGRCLFLGWFGSYWNNGDYRFLAVRN